MRVRWFLLSLLVGGLACVWWIGSSLSDMMSMPRPRPSHPVTRTVRETSSLDLTSQATPIDSGNALPEQKAALDAVDNYLKTGNPYTTPSSQGAQELTVEQRNARWIGLQMELTDAPPPEKAAVIDKIRALAESGDAHAQMFMGNSYMTGHDVPMDRTEAQRWFAMAGQPRAFVDPSGGQRPANASANPDSSSGPPSVIVSELPSPTGRYLPVYQEDYHGTHPDLFAQYKDRVRLLLQQSQIEISSRLGLLQYREGFQCPLLVAFHDQAAPGVEHALAYVQIIPDGGHFAQMMVVNLGVMASYPQEDFDKVFYHEMTHAVLNDAVVSVAKVPLPSWVQEGLAVYIDGEGEIRVNAMAIHVRKSQVNRIVRDLQDPVLDYARNYLAFKFMVDRQNINTLQTFVRDLTHGMSPSKAIEDSTGMSWVEFRQKVKEFSADTYREYAI